MYSDFAIEQVESVSTFQKYWNNIKSFIPNLITLPSKIKGLQQEALGWSIKTKNEDLKKEFSLQVSRLSPMHTLAVNIKDKIDKYLPHWKSQEKSSGVSGFGLVPVLVMGAVALGALAYVSVKGLSLLKQYAREKQIIDDLKTRAISLEEAKTLIKETRPKEVGATFVESITEKITTPLMIPLLIGGSVLAYMMISKFRGK